MYTDFYIKNRLPGFSKSGSHPCVLAGVVRRRSRVHARDRGAVPLAAAAAQESALQGSARRDLLVQAGQRRARRVDAKDGVLVRCARAETALGEETRTTCLCRSVEWVL